MALFQSSMVRTHNCTGGFEEVNEYLWKILVCEQSVMLVSLCFIDISSLVVLSSPIRSVFCTVSRFSVQKRD